MIKANGYGHGMAVAAQTLGEANEFGVTDFDDALNLRAQGVSKPLTLLSPSFNSEDLVLFSQQNIRPVIYDYTQLAMFDDLPSKTSLDVWLKVDTGMGRLGFSIDEAHGAFTRLNELSEINSLSVMSHLANADRPEHPENDAQFKRFTEFVASHSFSQASILNSAGTIAFSERARDMVRPGLMLYGISPLIHSPANELELRPVMTFKSEIISVRTLPAGSSIGYGSSYSLDADTRVAVISAGYGDGYPRHAPSGTPIFINDMLVPLIGRVSMDLISVDLGGVVAEVGDSAILWGDGNPIENIAQLAGTIPYELTCGITPRVERVII